MLAYNEITVRKYIIFEDEPYEVLDSHVFRKQQRKPVNATKLKNLITGKVKEHSFHVSDKADEAELKSREVKYLYTNKGEFWFCEANDPAKRFTLSAEQIGEKQAQFLKPNGMVSILMFEETMLGVKMPIKMELKVKEAPPGIKGDSSRGGMKQITLETGAVINAPLFINENDTIVVNTETGDYVERKS
jgi:elongation factor P